MKSNGFRNLLVITVLLAVAAVWAWTDHASSDAPPGAGEKVLPGMTEALNDIDRVVAIGSHGTITLAKQGGEWFIEEWGGFPAKFETVKAAVVGAEGLVIDAPKTKRPDLWNDLGVEDPGAGRDSIRLKFSTGGEAVGDLIVGRMKGRDAVYVRRTGEDQAWLARGRLSPPRLPTAWVDAEILSIPPERIQRVVIQHADGERLTVKRTGDGPNAWQLREMDLGYELRSPGLLSSVASALSRMSLEAAMPAVAVDAALPEWTSTRYETNDGVAITVRTAEVDGRTVARFSAEALPPKATDVEGPAPDGAASADRTPQEIAMEVAALNAQAGTWTYVLPAWKVQSLVKRMDDLVQAQAVDEDDALDMLENLGSGGQDGG